MALKCFPHACYLILVARNGSDAGYIVDDVEQQPQSPSASVRSNQIPDVKSRQEALKLKCTSVRDRSKYAFLSSQ